jgi:putative tricarboxylic transport membrane protein
VIVLAALGAFTYRQRVDDIFVACLFGVVGYYLKKHGWPRVPLVIALLLGEAFEMNLHVTMRLTELGRLDPFARPVTLVLLVLTALNLVLPALRRRASALAANP